MSKLNDILIATYISIVLLLSFFIAYVCYNIWYTADLSHKEYQNSLNTSLYKSYLYAFEFMDNLYTSLLNGTRLDGVYQEDKIIDRILNEDFLMQIYNSHYFSEFKDIAININVNVCGEEKTCSYTIFFTDINNMLYSSDNISKIYPFILNSSNILYSQYTAISDSKNTLHNHDYYNISFSKDSALVKHNKAKLQDKWKASLFIKYLEYNQYSESSTLSLSAYIPIKIILDSIQGMDLTGSISDITLLYNRSLELDNDMSEFKSNNSYKLFSLNPVLDVFAVDNYVVHYYGLIWKALIIFIIITVIFGLIYQYISYIRYKLANKVQKIENILDDISLNDGFQFSNITQFKKDEYGDLKSLDTIYFGLEKYIELAHYNIVSNMKFKEQQIKYLSIIMKEMQVLLSSDVQGDISEGNVNNDNKSSNSEVIELNNSTDIGVMLISLKKAAIQSIAFSAKLNGIIKELRESLEVKKQLSELHKELKVAKTIQDALLPNDISCDLVDIDGYMLGAEYVAGDFYDFFYIDENKIGVIVADVSGKGITASIFSSACKSIIRSVNKTYDDPGKLLAHVNNELIDQNKEELFVTVVYCIVDFEKGTLRYSTAGHYTPFIVYKEGYNKDVIGESAKIIPSVILGSFPNVEFKSHVLQLDSIKRFVLYSDGVTEAQGSDGIIYGDDRWHDALIRTANESHDTVIKTLVDEITAFTNSDHNFDDISIVVVNIKNKKQDTNIEEAKVDKED